MAGDPDDGEAVPVPAAGADADDRMDADADGDADADAPPHPPVRRTAAFFRGLYHERLDYGALARADPDFAAVLRRGGGGGPGPLDFRDPAAVVQLTRTLLRRDFGLALALPPDRLCPPVPNRHSYVLWLQALLDGSSEDGDVDGPADARLGIDVGTGASCIYPLLACAQRPRWRFAATDVDAASLQWARANVARNGLADRIRVVARPLDDDDGDDDDGALLPLGRDGVPDRADFVMVNPPFYASAAEMAAAAAAKQRPPHAVCTGAAVEMVYAARPADGRRDGGGGGGGGEVAFVGRLLAESAVLRTRVTWYTAMLGKLASLVALVAQLRARGIDNYAVAVFARGTGGGGGGGRPPKAATRRWALAWSYGARRPTVAVARGGCGPWSTLSADSSGLESCRHILPPITEADVWCGPSDAAAAAAAATAARLSTAIDALMRGLALAAWTWDAPRGRGVGRARENVWGRAWRRRKLRQEAGQLAAAEVEKTREAAKTADTAEAAALGFVVTLRVGVAETSVRCRWLEGHSEALFQSFCGFLKTRLAASLAAGPADEGTA